MYVRQEVKQRLRTVREERAQAKWVAAEASAKLHAEVTAAKEILTVTDIARSAGISRRAVYDILKAAESDLD